MAGLNTHVSNPETSANPATGLVTGDTDPSSTQDGPITKLRDQDGDIETDILDLVTIWNPHNHAGGSGGPPIGTGPLDEDENPTVVRAIKDNAVRNAKIADGDITGAITEDDAIGEAEILDESVTQAKLGAPSTYPASGFRTVAPGSSLTFTHNKGRYLLFHVEGNGSDMEAVKISETLNAISALNAEGAAPLPMRIVYYG